jgi:hypothetical protein
MKLKVAHFDKQVFEDKLQHSMSITKNEVNLVSDECIRDT